MKTAGPNAAPKCNGNGTIMLNLTINWKSVVDSLHKGVVVIDRGGTIRHINPAFEVLTGYGASELLGKTCTVLACSACSPSYGKTGFRCMLFETGEPLKPMACLINNKHGEPLKVFRKASILKDERGNPLGAVETVWSKDDLINKSDWSFFPYPHPSS